jgi:hypothetical protein
LLRIARQRQIPFSAASHAPAVGHDRPFSRATEFVHLHLPLNAPMTHEEQFPMLTQTLQDGDDSFEVSVVELLRR